MHTLFFIISTITLGKVSWIDLSGLLATITLTVYVYRFARSRVTKEDMDLALEKKASKKSMESEFKLRDQRIKHVENLSIIQDKYLKDTLEEHHAILDTVQNDIKEILKRLK